MFLDSFDFCHISPHKSSIAELCWVLLSLLCLFLVHCNKYELHLAGWFSLDCVLVAS